MSAWVYAHEFTQGLTIDLCAWWLFPHFSLLCTRSGHFSIMYNKTWLAIGLGQKCEEYNTHVRLMNFNKIPYY